MIENNIKIDKDIKFDIKKFNMDMNIKIKKNREENDKKLNKKIYELNKKNDDLEKIKINNEPYIIFIDNLLINFKLIIKDFFNLNFKSLFNDDDKLLYLGIWMIIFSLLLYVLCD